MQLVALGKTSEAAEILKTALRLQPNFGKAHGNLGCLLLESGKFDEAIAHFQAALRENPVSEDYRYNLRIALQKKTEAGKNGSANSPKSVR